MGKWRMQDWINVKCRRTITAKQEVFFFNYSATTRRLRECYARIFIRRQVVWVRQIHVAYSWNMGYFMSGQLAGEFVGRGRGTVPTMLIAPQFLWTLHMRSSVIGRRSRGNSGTQMCKCWTSRDILQPCLICSAWDGMVQNSVPPTQDICLCVPLFGFVENVVKVQFWDRRPQFLTYEV